MPRPDSTQSCWKPRESHRDEEYPCRDSTRPDRRSENSLGRYFNNVAEQAHWSWFRISLSNLRQPRFEPAGLNGNAWRLHIRKPPPPYACHRRYVTGQGGDCRTENGCSTGHRVAVRFPESCSLRRCPNESGIFVCAGTCLVFTGVACCGVVAPFCGIRRGCVLGAMAAVASTAA